MPGSPSFFVSPGEVSVDILEAVKKALSFRLQRVRQQPKLFSQLKEGANIAGLSLRQAADRSVSPIKRLVYSKTIVRESAPSKAKRIKRELLDAGTTFYGLIKSESRYLPRIMHDDEHVMAVVYGQHHSCSAMLVATDERIIYVDKKPMAELFDEVSYEVVSGIEFDIHLFFASVVLHTAVKNYDFKYVNLHCAEKFARYIESQRLEQQQDQSEDQEDLAGYYWLSQEEAEERRRIQGEAL